MKTAELQEQRAATLDRMNTAHSADDDAAFTAAETELRTLDVKLDRQRKIDAAERAKTATPLTTRDGGEFAELRNQSLIETLRYGAGMAVTDRAKIEREQAMLAERAGGPAKGVYVATELFEKRSGHDDRQRLQLSRLNRSGPIFSFRRSRIRQSFRGWVRPRSPA